MFEEAGVSLSKGKGVLQNSTVNQPFTSSVNFNSIWFDQELSNYGTNHEQKLFKARPTLSIDSIFIKAGWTKDEEEELFALHDEIGNKWAVLANRLYGRTDNCVKNHFYSKLRKAMRKLNKYIHDFYRKEFKEIKINAIYKIVQGNEEKFKPTSTVDPSTTEFCQKLKNRLLRFYDDDQNEVYQEKPEIKKIVSQIIQFNKNYKRQIRRKRKGSGDTEWSKKEPKKRKNSDDIYSSSQQEQQQEDFNFPVVTVSSPTKRRPTRKNTINPQKQSKEDFSQLENIDKHQAKQANLLPLIPIIRPTASRIQMEQEQGIQSILRSAGMMEDGYQMPMIFLKKDFSILSRLSRPVSDNPNDQHDAFFDQSDLHNIGKTNGFNPFEYMREQHNDYE